MSNRVILRLLERTLTQIPESRYEHLHENHPLITFLELRLSRMWALAGGTRCPELERRIRELQERSPKKLERLVEGLVREYYQPKGPPRRIPPPPWVRKRGRREERVVEAVA
ncbi:MAG: hypothetical protein ACE5Z5_04830 [Candidatus Bathyarchaeia archaeon]